MNNISLHFFQQSTSKVKINAENHDYKTTKLYIKTQSLLVIFPFASGPHGITMLLPKQCDTLQAENNSVQETCSFRDIWCLRCIFPEPSNALLPALPPTSLRPLFGWQGTYMYNKKQKPHSCQAFYPNTMIPIPFYHNCLS